MKCCRKKVRPGWNTIPCYTHGWPGEKYLSVALNILTYDQLHGILTVEKKKRIIIVCMAVCWLPSLTLLFLSLFFFLISLIGDWELDGPCIFLSLFFSISLYLSFSLILAWPSHLPVPPSHCSAFDDSDVNTYTHASFIHRQATAAQTVRWRCLLDHARPPLPPPRCKETSS